MADITPGAPLTPNTLGESDLIFPLLMNPFFDPKPWGGRRLQKRFNKPIPDGKIGESWEISTTGGKVSRVDGGPLDGLPLDEVLRRWPNAAMGRLAGKEFPLLVKLIDASENLSVQVHPDDATAQRLENFPRGKTESWIVLDAGGEKGEGEVIHGIVKGTARDQMAAAADSPDIEQYLRRVPIRPGTVVPVTAGTVHAILAGTLLCEVQQASDITYRLYDWNRKPKRELHIEQSLESIDFESAPPDVFDLPETTNPYRRPRAFLDLNYFTLALVDLPADGNPTQIDLADGDFALAVVLNDGGDPISMAGVGAEDIGVESLTLRAGRSVFIPAAVRGVLLQSTTSARILWVRPGNA